MMRNILPESVLASIREAYIAGVKNAQEAYVYAQEDEDVVTGALGQAMVSTDRAIVDDGTVYVWRISYQKFRGRGKNATERLLGADGIFQIEIRDGQGNVAYRKGLLFQAKNRWHGKNQALARQAGLLSFLPGVAVIINYSDDGYSSFSAEVVSAAEGDRRRIPSEEIKDLATTLAYDFLLCEKGYHDVYYDPLKKQLYLPFTIKPRKEHYPHVITTEVVRVET